ncbi:hypothetical protein, variant 2 [Exophiala xenobiotica]|uniref:Transcription factor domain-containing protein n=1 Tax=Exophiala xenobiotica TaxID=348802 RepID=A0A0D2EBJ2_9EURO|nr:hypothetical protein, variant 2 [Exophiala xenobiotica]XP_013312585.1 hypothetical protein, variant 1 [Exophiala xenobiotica]XP_013312586.1 uncharacterized protein PV05_10664 [Exophiala xenobiotica]KIW52000.1 hypothetical protein PV05_10664 [Exophiala xenobiotica]KIW52001.1 hypothetical protein, variant 1 [Exophiala xenobiotica]KIW52002.1 hypothetical protein, variant 2 [Exophiala xenobiotica]
MESGGNPVNALHGALGVYLPQLAYHFEPTKNALISAASTALELETSLSSTSDLQASLLKQSVMGMHSAIRCVLKEKQLSVLTVATSLLLVFVAIWTGRWEEYKCHLYHCLKLSRQAKANGEEIDQSFMTCVNALVRALQSLPSVTNPEPRFRLDYALSVVLSTKSWTVNLVDPVKSPNLGEGLKRVMLHYLTRASWIVFHWRPHSDMNSISELDIKRSPFSEAIMSVERFETTTTALDLPLLVTQLSVALRTTLLYAAYGNSQLIRDVAVACHGLVSILKVPQLTCG